MLHFWRGLVKVGLEVQHMAERLLKVEEAAERLGVTPFTVRVWLRSGKLRGGKTSAVMQGRWRVPESAIGEMIEPHKAQSAG